MACVEERVAAALAVLGGEDPAAVAAACGVEPELVDRWVELFREGGTARLAGRMDADSSEARDRFLVLIAHEFRTPLAIIGGWVETMIGGELPADVRDRALQVIRKQVAHLERIARDAVDAGAVARGQLRLVVEPVKLRSLVATVITSLHDPRLALLPGREVEVIADATRLEQVVGGVLEHAGRMAGDTTVGILIEPFPDEVLVEAQVEGRELSFAEASVLFEPYARTDTSLGTGLGLYLARALLAAHGGQIGIRSGQGMTTLWFRLPCTGPTSGPLVHRG